MEQLTPRQQAALLYAWKAFNTGDRTLRFSIPPYWNSDNDPDPYTTFTELITLGLMVGGLRGPMFHYMPGGRAVVHTKDYHLTKPGRRVAEALAAQQTRPEGQWRNLYPQHRLPDADYKFLSTPKLETQYQREINKLYAGLRQRRGRHANAELQAHHRLTARWMVISAVRALREIKTVFAERGVPVPKVKSTAWIGGRMPEVKVNVSGFEARLDERLERHKRRKKRGGKPYRRKVEEAV